jgi:DNA invertase Pin-like site-specific DNA recombinase
MPRKTLSPVIRHIALCYVRKSWTRDASDTISPERQRDHIQAVCDQHGWQPEWYEDVEGHRSGMHENNRPGWLALKARLGDSDVVALVANDLSRLHRKGWRVGDLLETVDRHGVRLILADPLRQMDFSSPTGRVFAQLSALFDEWYASDISQRGKSEIAHRKSKGITVGLPPFGTKRDKTTGFLIPSDEGAWLLPDGKWLAGRIGEQPPTEGAIWRGYYDCAGRILTLYADQKGRESICRNLQDEGWAFRNRKGQPEPIEVDDVRRVTSNFAEYGGYVSEKRARERHPSEYPPDEIIAKLNPERAVFDIDLLARVARSRQQRAIGKHPARGVNKKARAYPLAGVTYCAHCERMAEVHNNPRQRSLLSGRLGKYYRHKPGGACGCSRQSVTRDVYEADFVRLIQALDITPESITLMEQLAVQLNRVGEDKEDLEKQKAEAIALCNRRIQAAIDLYGDGRISREEYLQRVERNERELAAWQARTTETEKLAMELSMCLQAVDTINKLWSVSSDDDKQGMARLLFEYITYDLDKQQIVDFRLKPWAEQFLFLRIGLYMQEHYSPDYNDNPIAPTGLEPVSSP